MARSAVKFRVFAPAGTVARARAILAAEKTLAVKTPTTTTKTTR